MYETRQWLVFAVTHYAMQPNTSKAAETKQLRETVEREPKGIWDTSDRWIQTAPCREAFGETEQTQRKSREMRSKMEGDRERGGRETKHTHTRGYKTQNKTSSTYDRLWQACFGRVACCEEYRVMAVNLHDNCRMRGERERQRQRGERMLVMITGVRMAYFFQNKGNLWSSPLLGLFFPLGTTCHSHRNRQREKEGGRRRG